MPLVLVDRQDGVAEVTLNRPDALNAFDLEMRKELREVVRTLRDDPEVRAVLLTGAGRAFCAGGDVRTQRAMLGQPAGPRMGALRDIQFDLLYMEKPLVVAVNGVAAGAGLGLVLLGDLVYFAESTRLFFAFPRVGLAPDNGIAYLLTRHVGLQRAKRLLLTASTLSAGDAESLGLGTVVADGELMATARADAAKLAGGPTLALGLTRQIVHRGLDLDFAAFMDAERLAQGEALRSADHAEGVEAFVAKREPRFVGR